MCALYLVVIGAFSAYLIGYYNTFAFSHIAYFACYFLILRKVDCH